MRIFIILLLLLAGCETYQDKSTFVVLKHPVTHEFKECEVETDHPKYIYTKVASCKATYEKLGYQFFAEQ